MTGTESERESTTRALGTRGGEFKTSPPKNSAVETVEIPAGISTVPTAPTTTAKTGIVTDLPLREE
jgi:hypothetical protein